MTLITELVPKMHFSISIKIGNTDVGVSGGRRCNSHGRYLDKNDTLLTIFHSKEFVGRECIG